MTDQQDHEYLGVEIEDQKPPPPPETRASELTSKQKQALEELLNHNAHLFAKDMSEIGLTDLAQHRIDLDEKLVFKCRLKQQPYPNQQHTKFIENEVEQMLKHDIIEPARSPYGFPVVVVGKKNGKQRFCVNYSELNKCTIPFHYPYPRAEDLFNNIGTATWFTNIDLASGYWQVPMDPWDMSKTTFICHLGSYWYKRMPFGLTNAPAEFQ